MYSKARLRYNEESIYTASPTRQFLMLFDRLILDLDGAQVGFDSHDLSAVHHSLRHAQDVVHLLMVSLREDIWAGAKNLRDVYGYALSQLIQANLTKEEGFLHNAEGVLRTLHQTWWEASRLIEHPSERVDGVA